MSLNNLKNPIVANELIKNFKKRYSTKICMHPQDGHTSQIVSAHTLSVGSMLSEISLKSHVYTVISNVYSGPSTHPLSIGLKGIRDVSVFNGFCSKHDVELFSCLEKEEITLTKQQCFMLSYRAIAHECYLKTKQAESLPLKEDYLKVHGTIQNTIQNNELFQQLAEVQEASVKGAEDIISIKNDMDTHLISRNWDSIESRILSFNKKPSVICSGCFMPFYNLQGSQLQDYENFSNKMSVLFISIIPKKNGGAAVFSWLKSSNSAPENYFLSIEKDARITDRLINLVIQNFENVAISPTWYESLSQDKKAHLVKLSQITDNLGFLPPSWETLQLDDWSYFE